MRVINSSTKQVRQTERGSRPGSRKTKRPLRRPAATSATNTVSSLKVCRRWYGHSSSSGRTGWGNGSIDFFLGSIDRAFLMSVMIVNSLHI